MKTYYINVSSLCDDAFDLLQYLVESKIFNRWHTELIARDTTITDSLLYVVHNDPSIVSYEGWNRWSLNLREMYYSETVIFPVVTLQDKDVHQIQLNVSFGFPPFYLTCLED